MVREAGYLYPDQILHKHKKKNLDFWALFFFCDPETA